MNFLILGAGGIGSFYGARLILSGHNVTFVARGEHLRTLQQHGLKLQHPKFSFDNHINASTLENVKQDRLISIDAVILTTKSTSTTFIAKELSLLLNTNKRCPFIISLQNGVENEEILCNYFPKDKIIGGLTRKIGAHIIKPGVIEVTGNVETIVGALEITEENTLFLDEFSKIVNTSGIICDISLDIKLELWKKLIINNGVNALCALLEEKTGIIMHHNKLSKLVYGLMIETASAAKYSGINISKKEIDAMYKLILEFDSIKPSMLVDKEFTRPLEIDQICGIVIKNNDFQNIDSPYTRTISTLLEYTYVENKNKI